GAGDLLALADRGGRGADRADLGRELLRAGRRAVQRDRRRRPLGVAERHLRSRSRRPGVRPGHGAGDRWAGYERDGLRLSPARRLRPLGGRRHGRENVDDDSTITAHVPDRFSSGKVKVTNPSGSGSSAEPFAVTKVSRFAPATAKAGTTVTISGQGLGSATSVDFPNHAAVAVASAAPGYVKVVVPADATYGPLDVHTPNIDPAGIATTRFKATPTIASSTPDGKVGSAVTITGANLSDATAVKFGSIGMTFSADPAGTSISTTVPAGVASSARITVVTPHG